MVDNNQFTVHNNSKFHINCSFSFLNMTTKQKKKKNKVLENEVDKNG